MAELDMVVKGGTIVDGTLLPRYRGDIGIKDGRIARIGKVAATDADRVIDATGQIVAPGIIDVHTHFDAQIFWDPYCTTSGLHGITTAMLGNCGFGFAPVAVDEREALMRMLAHEIGPYAVLKAGVPWDWETYPQYLDALQRTPKGVNVASYVPTSLVIASVMGLQEALGGRPPTEAEMIEMQGMMAEALAAGGYGWAANRGEVALDEPPEYPTQAMPDELFMKLAEVVGARGRGTITIDAVRGSGDPFDFTDERHRFIERLAETAASTVIYSSIVAIPGYPEAHRRALDWLASCNARGLRMLGQGVTIRPSLQYTLDNLDVRSSGWQAALSGSVDDKLAALADPGTRAQLTADGAIPMVFGGGNLDRFVVTDVGSHRELDGYVGRTVADIAVERGTGSLDALIDLSISSRLELEFNTGVVLPGGGNAPGVAELMGSPYVLPGASDGGAHTQVGCAGPFGTDLIAWMGRDEGTVSLEELHWHLSYLPAQAIGLGDRGFLREGAVADVIVYDLDALRVVPEHRFERVYDFPAGEYHQVQRAEGLRYTIVDGQITFEDGVCTGALPGELLRSA